MSDAVKVDIWSDIVCPFCYIGKRKFEAAVSSSGVPVEVEYHSFELAPDTPEDVTGTHAEMLAAKMHISVDEAHTMERHMTGAAREVGLDFQHARMQPAKTLRAHELLHYAKGHGRQVEMKERLLAAYFTEGRHVGRIDELSALAAEVGLDRDDVVRSLDAREHLPGVDADIRQAREYGIRGVPFFVLDLKYAVSGAQDPATFAGALARARDEKAVTPA